MRRPSFVIAALALTLFGCSTTRPAPPPQPKPLVVASCPPLVPLNDDSFGAWVLWSQYAAGQYVKCRAAALGQK